MRASLCWLLFFNYHDDFRTRLACDFRVSAEMELSTLSLISADNYRYRQKEQCVSAQLRSNYTREYHWRRPFQIMGPTFFWLAATGWILILIVSALVTLDHNLDKKDVAASYANLAAGFHHPGQTPAERQRLAKGMISARQNGIDLSLGGKFASDSQRATMWQAVQQAADTGELPRLAPPQGGWHSYFLNVGGGIFGCAVAASFITFVFYSSECISMDPQEFIADFPWRKRWPYAFVLLTIVGAPFYAVSLVRIARHKHRLPPTPEAVDSATIAEPCDAAPTTVDFALGWTNDDSAAVERLTGCMADEQQYFEMRTALLTRQTNNALHKIDQEIARITEKIADFGRRIGNQRRLLAKFEQRAAALKKAQASAQQPTRDDTDIEYRCLRQLTGVIAIEISEHPELGQQITLIVQARYTYEGTTYDLGDWALTTNARHELTAYEVRSGVLERCPRRAPVYRIGAQFCFGDTKDHVRRLFRDGQLVEGFSIAVASLQHINEEDRALIPRSFRIANPG